MRDDRDAAEPVDVFDDIAGMACERIRRGAGQAEGHDVAAVVLISTASMQSTPWRYAGGSGGAGAVAMIGQDDERSPARAAAAATSSTLPGAVRS